MINLLYYFIVANLDFNVLISYFHMNPVAEEPVGVA